MGEHLEQTTQRIFAAQRGDRQALARLIRDHLPYVRHIVAIKMGAGLARLVEVDDIVQEALADALLGLEHASFDSRGAFRAWLARIAENRLRDEKRWHTAAKRAPAGGRMTDLDSQILVATVGPPREPTPSQVASSIELAERIESALLCLPDRERCAIVMRRYESKSFEDIAEELGLGSEASSRALLARALARLSDLI